jgi:anthraniloyl-CoA monooxygenase
VITVGGVFGIDHVHTILGAGRADLVAIARAHLADPHLTARAAAAAGLDVAWPPQYVRARTLPRP